MTFPGADTMKAGIIGVDALRSRCARGLRLDPLLEPLRCICSTSACRDSPFGGMSGVGEVERVLVGGVY
jgi:hypothetical protein